MKSIRKCKNQDAPYISIARRLNGHRIDGASHSKCDMKKKVQIHD